MKKKKEFKKVKMASALWLIAMAWFLFLFSYPLDFLSLVFVSSVFPLEQLILEKWERQGVVNKRTPMMSHKRMKTMLKEDKIMADEGEKR